MRGFRNGFYNGKVVKNRKIIRITIVINDKKGIINTDTCNLFGKNTSFRYGFEQFDNIFIFFITFITVD